MKFSVHTGIHRRVLGRSRGGFTSKVHCLSDARGRPIAFHLTPGEAADCKVYDVLIDLAEQTPKALLADKAYDADDIRDDLKKRGIKPVIPPKSNRKATIRYNKNLYRERNWIERMIGHLKINRAIAARYDKLADNFLGMLYVVTSRYWIKFVHGPIQLVIRLIMRLLHSRCGAPKRERPHRTKPVAQATPCVGRTGSFGRNNR
jgi:transposase